MQSFSLAAPSVNRKLPFGPSAPLVKLDEKYQPKTLSDVVGQGNVVYQLQSFVEAPYSTVLLFSGETGIGKTTCALALANDLNVNTTWGDIDEIGSGECLDERLDKALRLLRQRGVNGWRMLIIDEADTMSAKCKQVLLSAMEPRNLPSGVVIVLTTNHPEKLETRFLDRCEHVRFASDCDLLLQDAQTLVNRVWLGETGCDDFPNVLDLHNLCQGGAMSFRRVVSSVGDLLRVRSMAPKPVALPEPVQALPEFSEPLPVSGGSPDATDADIPSMDTPERETTKPYVVSGTETHFVKAKKPSDKVWRFLGSRGSLTRLRIHASRYTAENAAKEVAQCTIDNPEYTFKAVPIDKTPRPSPVDPEPVADESPVEPVAIDPTPVQGPSEASEPAPVSGGAPDLPEDGRPVRIKDNPDLPMFGQTGTVFGIDKYEGHEDRVFVRFPGMILVYHLSQVEFIEPAPISGGSPESVPAQTHVSVEAPPEVFHVEDSAELPDWSHDSGINPAFILDSYPSDDFLAVADDDEDFEESDDDDSEDVRTPEPTEPAELIVRWKGMIEDCVWIGRSLAQTEEYPFTESCMGAWDCMDQPQRLSVDALLDAVDQPRYELMMRIATFDRLVRFVMLCSTGSEVSFPVPPLPDLDRERMERVAESTLPPDPGFLAGGNASMPGKAPSSLSVASESAEWSNHTSDDTEAPEWRIEARAFLDTIVIKGETYWVKVSDDGIELSKPGSKDVHYIIDGPSGPECSCHSHHYRPGPCKHLRAVQEQGYLPDWTDAALSRLNPKTPAPDFPQGSPSGFPEPDPDATELDIKVNPDPKAPDLEPFEPDAIDLDETFDPFRDFVEGGTEVFPEGDAMHDARREMEAMGIMPVCGGSEEATKPKRHPSTLVGADREDFDIAVGKITLALNSDEPFTDHEEVAEALGYVLATKIGHMLDDVDYYFLGRTFINIGDEISKRRRYGLYKKP